MLRLMLTTAGGEPRIISLEGKLPLTIGRSENAGLVLADRKVSRRHAEIGAEADGSLFVEDLASRTGTRVNGQTISARTRLGAGDVIEVLRPQRPLPRRDRRRVPGTGCRSTPRRRR